LPQTDNGITAASCVVMATMPSTAGVASTAVRSRRFLSLDHRRSLKIRIAFGLAVLFAGATLAATDRIAGLASAFLTGSGSDRVVRLALLLHALRNASVPELLHVSTAIALLFAAIPLLVAL
jgi:hypothetical protein